MMEDKTQNFSQAQLEKIIDLPDESDLAGLTQDQLINLFIERLIKEKGGPSSELERNRIADNLKDFVMTEILMNLPDYLVNKINDSLDSGEASDELIDGAIEESGIDANKIAEQAMLRFRENYLNNSKEEA